MRTKNAKAISTVERAHLSRVKELPCSVCDEAGPSDAHHVKQGSHWTCIALCHSCHQGPLLGLHGEKRAWAIRKMDEIDALAVTVRRLMTRQMEVA